MDFILFMERTPGQKIFHALSIKVPLHPAKDDWSLICNEFRSPKLNKTVTMVKEMNNTKAGESEYSRDQANPYDMADYLMDKGFNFRGYGPKGFKLKDDWILHQVLEILLRDPHIDISDIDIKVDSGVVTLTGHVDSRRTKKIAELSIEGLVGVKDVMNFLTFLPAP